MKITATEIAGDYRKFNHRENSVEIFYRKSRQKSSAKNKQDKKMEATRSGRGRDIVLWQLVNFERSINRQEPELYPVITGSVKPYQDV